ncbi:putative ribonuclease H protein [Citrus sinensis]|uniref:Ribonuclease H protein n=1 Tax=Citrus sinensis TaxID=2711 RepID=A0ACB8LCU9_CITSI|nr:putative ribonuclease H protein [Citrus sinensis]
MLFLLGMAPICGNLWVEFGIMLSVDYAGMWLLELAKVQSSLAPSCSDVNCFNRNGTDQVYWAAPSQGNFTVKSAYDILDQSHVQERDNYWRLAWSWKAPQSIKIFIWLVLHNRLKTRAELASRHLHIDPSCERCGAGLESTIHVLRDCPYSRAIWLRFLRGNNQHHFFETNFADWMSENLQTSNTFLGSKLWRVTFGVAIWRLWFWRNRFIFTEDYWESNNIAVDIKVTAAEIQRCNSFPLAADMARIEKWIRWIAPTWPWVKLNTDGAMKSSGRAGAGGLIRDYRGVWQTGCSANLGVCSVTSAELWGLFHGLSIAWLYGFRRVIVEVDSKCVLQLVSHSSPIINEHFSLIQVIQELLRRDWLIQVQLAADLSFCPKPLLVVDITIEGPLALKLLEYLALEGGNVSLVSQMGPSLGGKFSYCMVPLSLLEAAKSTKINFGTNGVVSCSGVISTPLVARNPKTFYFLPLEAISVGNQRIKVLDSSSSGTKEGNAIIDSGFDQGLAIYGKLMQMNFLVGYDTEKRTVSFKQTDCTNR